MKIYPVILSGGAGTRLWPLSRASMPKQLLPLVTDKTMLQETALRVRGWPGLMAPLVVCGNEHRFLVAEQLREVGITPSGILLEPVGRNTAPAVTAAARHLLAHDPDAIMLVLPADHVIEKNEAFRQAVERAHRLVQDGSLATFGIVPSVPETGYGYIRRGEPLPGCDDCFKIERFVEKPDRNTAEGFVADGGFYWNSGMFMFRADRFLAEIEQHAPEIAKAAGAAMHDAYRDLDFCRLDEAAFTACPSDSIDYAVMEHTRDGVVVSATSAGATSVPGRRWPTSSRPTPTATCSAATSTWTASAIAGARREPHRGRGRRQGPGRGGNPGRGAGGAQGPGPAREEHRRPPEGQERTEHLYHTRVYRPWGFYEGIDAGERFQVKRICVKPGEKLSCRCTTTAPSTGSWSRAPRA
jgi:mannose-1-phosphate guanylyltransferase/mannose-6-phosphate isomerase